MDFLKAIVAFRKGPWFRVLYVLVLSLIVYALIVIYPNCLTLILAPVVMFIVPYYMKERRLRHYALNGVVVLLVAGLLFAYVFASSLSVDPVPQSTSQSGILLVNGTVDPVRGPANGQFTFAVTLKVPAGGDPNQYEVWVNRTRVHATEFISVSSVRLNPADAGDLNLTDGKLYRYAFPVDDDIFFFWFAAVKTAGAGDTWVRTDGVVGPIVTGFPTFFGFAFVYGMLGLMLPVISLYFLILMLYWYTQRARVQRQALGGAPPPKAAATDTGFMCTNCGADVPEDAAKCPKCGAVFEEGEEPKKEKSADEEKDAKP